MRVKRFKALKQENWKFFLKHLKKYFQPEATRSLLQLFDSAIVAQNIQKQYLATRWSHLVEMLPVKSSRPSIIAVCPLEYSDR